MTHIPAKFGRYRDESGAVLILALMFMVITALLITGLSAWEGNDIKNIGNLRSARTTVYAADGAIQVAIANSRYEYLSSTPGEICPNTPSQPSTDPISIDGQPIVVMCQIGTSPSSCPPGTSTICSREETLSAYPQPQCMTNPCTGDPYVQTEVLFNDYTSLDINDCAVNEAQTTCGSTMTVYTYVNHVAST